MKCYFNLANIILYAIMWISHCLLKIVYLLHLPLYIQSIFVHLYLLLCHSQLSRSNILASGTKTHKFNSDWSPQFFQSIKIQSTSFLSDFQVMDSCCRFTEHKQHHNCLDKTSQSFHISAKFVFSYMVLVGTYHSVLCSKNKRN